MSVAILMTTPTATTLGSLRQVSFKEAAEHLSQVPAEIEATSGEVLLYDYEEKIYAMCPHQCATGFLKIVEILRAYYSETLVDNADYSGHDAAVEALSIPFTHCE